MKYSIYESLLNLLSFFYTKSFFRNARLLRLPIYIRNRNLLSFGIGFTTGYNCRLEMFDLANLKQCTLKIGKNCKFGDNVHISAGSSITLGDNCLIASKVYISDITHGNYSGNDPHSSPFESPDSRKLYAKEVFVGNNVWIGENVCILPGSVIGNGCIIGANSVVKGVFEENTILVGAPAKVIKKFDFEKKQWIKAKDRHL